MIRFVGKRGDTLIEVMLAVGIFSMVAVAVVAVMSGGTSSAQTALETTLTREEVDAQAEAIRFIQSSYIADKEVGESSRFGELWNAITRKAYNYTTGTIEENLAKYNPSDCSDLYSQGAEAEQHGFIINTRALSNFTSPNQVLFSGSSYLKESTTYPHLIFSEQNLDDNFSSSNLTAAEGIYIIAAKDPGDTNIVGGNNNKQSAYYDFYIRTCWYGTGDQAPSTISTVIRLYDPSVFRN